MVQPWSHPLRRARGLTALLAAGVMVLTGAAIVSVAPAAQADVPSTTALLLRTVEKTIYRQPIDPTTLTAGRGVRSQDGTDYPVQYFNSQVGSDFSSDESVALTAGLTPGTYSASRFPGRAEALLDAGSVEGCSDDGTDKLTVTQADYDDAGEMIDFAASFDVTTCDDIGSIAHGEIRWNSTVPLALVQPSAAATTRVTVGSSTEATVQFTSVGNSPATLGRATLSQRPVGDDSLKWAIVHDTCSGQTLEPAATCAVTARIAPVIPDGTPWGSVYADMQLPDGQPSGASAQVSAQVYPLSGQVLYLQARGAFRQIVLTWERPAAAPAGWSYRNEQYYVYQYLSDGSLRFVTYTANHTAVVTGLPDLFTARFVVRDEQSGADAPFSLPATATTASSELLVVASSGLLARRLAPDAATTYSPQPTEQQYLSNGATAGLTVARNQSRLGYSLTVTQTSPTRTTNSRVCTTGVDALFRTPLCSGTDTSTQWDDAPSLSPDGKRVVFVHALHRGAASTLEIGSTDSWAFPTVPNSAGLSNPTFNAAGTGLVAVQAAGDSTELVALSFSGTRVVIPGSTGLRDPDVAADGRIVALSPHPGSPWARDLALLSRGSTVPAVIASVGSGTDLLPRFAPDGRSVFFLHVGDQTNEGDQIDLASGAVTTLIPAGAASTPFVLTADGTHGLDTVAPTTQLVAPSSLVDLAPTVTANWWAADPQPATQVATGVRNFDVRYRTASVGHSFGAYVYPAAWQATPDRIATVQATPGSEYCFAARARDFAGNVSAWTAERCTVSPVDDRSLPTTASRLAGSSYYLHTYSYAAKKSTRFTLAGVTGRRVGLVATTCAACGEVTVSIGSRVLGRLNTHATTTHYRQTLWLPVTSTVTGTLTITTLTATPVRIDGVTVQH